MAMLHIPSGLRAKVAFTLRQNIPRQMVVFILFFSAQMAKSTTYYATLNGLCECVCGVSLA